MSNLELTTLILAAGKGTRMKSDLPKVLHPLLGRHMVDWVIDVAQEINSKEIILIIGHKKELVEEKLAHRGVSFAVQEPQLGTAHAVSQCDKQLKDFDGDVLVLSGDVPMIEAETLRSLRQHHAETQASATLLTTNTKNPHGYGRIIRDNDGNVIRIVEEKDADEETKKIQEVNCGIYLFKSRNLFKELPYVRNDNNQLEYYLPDVIKLMVKGKQRVSALITDDMSESHGVNTIEQLKEVEALMKKRLD